MSLTTTILMLILGWLAVAGAMLWGVLRITRRHHPQPREPRIESKKTARRPALCTDPACPSDKTTRPPDSNECRRPFAMAANQTSVCCAWRFCRARRASMFRLSMAAENAIAAYT